MYITVGNQKLLILNQSYKRSFFHLVLTGRSWPGAHLLQTHGALRRPVHVPGQLRQHRGPDGEHKRQDHQ